MKKFFFLSILSFSTLFSLKTETNEMLADIRRLLIKQGIKAFKEKEDNSEISTKKLTVDLKNPTFSNGILMTREGGVIKNKDIRIQARTIQYIKKIEDGKLVHRIEADGDLMIIYKNRVFVGEELEYDFIKKKGTIYEGKTYTSPWYIGGDKISLLKNGSYSVKNAYITTCENRCSAWDIHASEVKVRKKELLQAKKVRFRFFRFPLWLPSFKVNLKKFFRKPIFQYKVTWDKASGPRGTIRYQIYSWKELALFLRLDYRLKTGFGGAFETEYFSPHKRSSFITRSYIAEDVIPKDLKKRRRYRLQGALKHISQNKKTTLSLTWDKFSDIKMPSDFKSIDDFEIDTAKKTKLSWRHQKKRMITTFNARPRANNFETIKQEIPELYINFKPFSSKMGLIFSNELYLSYLDIAYSKDLSQKLNGIDSARFETKNLCYRPFHMGKFIVTPKIGIIAIGYSDSPKSDAKLLYTFSYDLNIKTNLKRYFKKHKHIITPYVNYEGLTEPNVSLDHNYIFSINDGYHRLNMVKVGILNEVFSLNEKLFLPRCSIDLFANSFIDTKRQKMTFPKIYLNLIFNLPSLSIYSENSWNSGEQNIDFSKLKIKRTVNENLAFAFELRYRSKYDWRKADHSNFIIDVARCKKSLLRSSLSDKRYSLLTHIFVRLGYYWTCHLESHHGWGRDDEKCYNEYKIDLYTTLSTSWKIKLSYQHTETDDRFSFDYFLLKF